MEISFTMTESIPITIALYNTQGQLIRTLYQDTPSLGAQKLSFQPGGLPVGLYVISVSSEGKVLGYEKIVVEE